MFPSKSGNVQPLSSPQGTPEGPRGLRTRLVVLPLMTERAVALLGQTRGIDGTPHSLLPALAAAPIAAADKA